MPGIGSTAMMAEHAGGRSTRHDVNEWRVAVEAIRLTTTATGFDPVIGGAVRHDRSGSGPVMRGGPRPRPELRV